MKNFESLESDKEEVEEKYEDDFDWGINLAKFIKPNLFFCVIFNF